MHNCGRALIEVISLYEMKKKYNERKISVTRALEHYLKIKEYFDLINHENLKQIKEEYKKYLEVNNLPLDNYDNLDNENDINSDYYVNKKKKIYILVKKIVYLQIVVMNMKAIIT